MVETSLNLGILETGENNISLVFALRSNKKSALKSLEENDRVEHRDDSGSGDAVVEDTIVTEKETETVTKTETEAENTAEETNE
mgnify:CR=1 FL=1